jgi:hypothetical protein
MISILYFKELSLTMTDDDDNNYDNKNEIIIKILLLPSIITLIINIRMTTLPQSLNSYETTHITKLGESLSLGKHCFPPAPRFNQI